MPRSPRDRRTADVDHPVEVQHGQVVDLAQRPFGAFQAHGFPSLLDSTDGLARGGDPSVRGPAPAARAVPRAQAEPTTCRGPGLAAALRPTVPGRRGPSQPVAGARPAASRRGPRAVAARVHGGGHDGAGAGRRPRRLPPRVQPRRPRRAPPRGDPPRPGRLAGRPDDPAGPQPGTHPAGPPRPGAGPAVGATGVRHGADRRVRGPQRPASPDLGDPGPRTAPRAGRGPGRLSGADRGRTPPVCRLPPHAGPRARRCVRPRTGDARRPGGHAVVPRADPPGPHRSEPRGPRGRRRDRRRRVRRGRPGRRPSRRWARTRWSPPTARCGRP